jgi:membrane associated rhomboid family serine protease
MLFLPYRVDLDLFRVPFVTIFVCLICIFIYYNQNRNERLVIETAEATCLYQRGAEWNMVLNKSMGNSVPETCLEMMWKIHSAKNKEQQITEFAEQGEQIVGFSKEYSIEYKSDVITKRYQDFSRRVPHYETQRLWYEPKSWDVVKMITASFSHGSWMHVIGNLFFFVAFAATIEVILGPIVFLVVVLTLALGTHTFYSIAMLGVSDPAPTVGLSGIVMGMMALFTFFLPHGKIRCFFWFFVFIKRFALPAWLLAGWFIGWNVYDIFTEVERSNVNLVAHVSGAGIGYLLGVIFFRSQWREVRKIVI